MEKLYNELKMLSIEELKARYDAPEISFSEREAIRKATGEKINDFLSGITADGAEEPIKELADFPYKFHGFISSGDWRRFWNAVEALIPENDIYNELKYMPIEELELMLRDDGADEADSDVKEKILVIRCLINEKIDTILTKNADASLEEIADIYLKYNDLFSVNTWDKCWSMASKHLKGKIPRSVPCPECRSMNPLENSTCGHCGAAMNNSIYFNPDYYVHREKYEHEIVLTDRRIALAMCFFMSWYGYCIFALYLEKAVDVETKIFVAKCRILSMLGMVCHILFWVLVIFAAKHGFFNGF